jgi:hypothetical protein
MKDKTYEQFGNYLVSMGPAFKPPVNALGSDEFRDLTEEGQLLVLDSYAKGIVKHKGTISSHRYFVTTANNAQTTL